MMEKKLLAALCALLLVNFGSADHDGNVALSTASKSTTDAPVAESVPTSSLDPVSHVATTSSPNGTDTSSGVTSTLSSDTSTEGKNNSEIPEPKKDNNTDIVSPADAAGAEKNLTNSTSQSPSPPSGSPSPTSHNPLTSTTISPSHSAHPAPVDTITTTITPTTTSHHAAAPLPDSTTASDQPAPLTSVPTPEPPKHETTTTTVTTRSSSTSSTSSSQELPSSKLTTLTSQNTEPVGHPGTSTEGHQTSTIPSASSSTAQTKAHADTPSQLNVGGDTTMVHDSPTLDPLLAGLVSAFIITAVIITLLLFLKLRRRDNRPEFRRLQDLPMDDMMEDTPLSMYSY